MGGRTGPSGSESWATLTNLSPSAPPVRPGTPRTTPETWTRRRSTRGTLDDRPPVQRPHLVLGDRTYEGEGPRVCVVEHPGLTTALPTRGAEVPVS